MCEDVDSWINDEEEFIKECYKQSDFKYFKENAEILISHGIDHYKKMSESDMEHNDHIYQAYLNIAVGCELLLKSIYLKNGYAINQTKNKEIIKFNDDVKGVLVKVRTHSFNTLINSAKTKVFSDLGISEGEAGKIKNVFRLINLKRNNLVHAGKKHFDHYKYAECIGKMILLLYNNAFSEEERNETFCSDVDSFIHLHFG
ncbi:MAG: hypothetical protein GQ567_00260 [Methanosarcinales archaeon]|nr:hypothetical protein [Methanosarcinales archaeon]